MTNRSLRSRPPKPANSVVGAQTTGPAAGTLLLTCGRLGLGGVTTGLGLTLCAMVAWAHAARTTVALVMVLGVAIAHTVGVHVVVHHADREAIRQRDNARAAAAHARYQASRRRTEEQRAWMLVDRIVSLENEVRIVRGQADQWTTAVLTQVVELQRQLTIDEPQGRHAASTSTYAGSDREDREERGTNHDQDHDHQRQIPIGPNLRRASVPFDGVDR